MKSKKIEIEKINSIKRNNDIKIISKQLEKRNTYISENFKDSFINSSIIAKQTLPLIKQWSSGVYNYNTNFNKNLPIANKITYKLIKNFFTAKPLAYNYKGKPRKLSVRRLFRLSLNTILVSKPEIKHYNNKINITLFLYNKKKNSLIRKINSNINKIKNLMLFAKSKDFLSSNKLTKFLSFSSKSISLKSNSLKKQLKNNKNRKVINNSFKLQNKDVISKGLNFQNKRLSFKQKTKASKFKLQNKKLSWLIKQRYYLLKLKTKSFLKSKYKLNRIYLKSLKKNHNSLFVSNMETKSKNKAYNLKNFKFSYTNSSPMLLPNIEKKKLVKNYMLNKNHSSNIYLTPKLYYNSIFNKNYALKLNNFILNYLILNNKFRARNTILNNNSKNITFTKDDFKKVIPIINIKITTSNIFKQKYMYKLFFLFNNLFSISKYLSGKKNKQEKSNYVNNKIFYSNSSKNLSLISNNVLLNTYKILSNNKVFKFLRFNKIKTYNLYHNILIYKNIESKHSELKPWIKNIEGIAHLKKNTKLNNLKNNSLIGKKISFQLKKRIKNEIIIQNNLKKINRFIRTYFITNHKKNSLNNIAKPWNLNLVNSSFEFTPKGNTKYSILNNVKNLYKFIYIKDILVKEIMFIHYIKLLSFNNSLYKSWFLVPLKNIVSKVYNKEVRFNIINLKYIYLNSDLLTQAIVLKLKNIKKVRLNKVLKKVLNMVLISKFNTYTLDRFNPTYKYIEQHFNKYKYINNIIFKSTKNHTNCLDNNTNSDLNTNNFILKNNTLKGLNSIQTKTINLIKYKSVFGLKLEASGRLTKRSTASRAVFKFRYKGNLKNKYPMTRDKNPKLIKSNLISNVQYSILGSKTRNGSFGIKTWINNN